MRHLILLSIILFLSHLGFAQAVGSMAPDFTLKNVDDQSFTLSDHKGKVVAVFLLGYGCPSCKGIAPSVQSELVDKFKSNENFVFTGIDTWDGTTAQVENFTKATKTTFEILQKGSKVAQSWETTYDRMVIIDSEGNITFKGNGLVSSHLDQAVSAVQTALDNMTTTAVRNLNENSFNISLYPNPVVNELNINFSLENTQALSGKIYNLTGKEVFKLTADSYSAGVNTLSIGTSEFKQGLHILQLQIGKKTVVEKFIVK